MRKHAITCICIAALLTPLLESLALGGPQAQNLDSILANVRSAWDGNQAMSLMRSVYGTDHFFTFPKFRQTSEFLKSAMIEAGLQHVEIIDAPADGSTQVGFWTMPLAWDAKSGTLEILDNTLRPEQRILADYEKVPASLGMWSGPTTQDGVTAEVIEITKDRMSTLSTMDLRGKLVLTDQNAAGIKWQLVKSRALGAINAFTENPSLQDGRQWINAWGDNGWAYTARSTPLLSFSITPRQATFVRDLLSRGPVHVRARVNTRYYAGGYPYVTAIIPGSGPEEVLTLGHTSEQGAQDNATGVAATLEAMATLQRLIAGGKLPPPKRSIRILSMGEMYGSMHYVQHHQDQIRNTVAAMCVDTPAGSYDIAGTEYTFYMNPHVAKDFTDAFVLKVAAEHLSKVQRPWHERSFATGTDTYMAEPMVGVPTVWGYIGSGVETHHNSEDTPDRVDVRSLRDISVINAAFLYFIANAGENEAQWLAELSETRAYQEIGKRVSSLLDRVASASTAADLSGLLADGNQQLIYAVDREIQATASVIRLVPTFRRALVSGALAPTRERLKTFGDQQAIRMRHAIDMRAGALGIAEKIRPVISADSQLPEAAKIIVKRKRFGSLPLDDLQHDQWEGYPSGAWAIVPTIALYWCDGHRNLAEVMHLTRMELGRTDFDFVGYFRFLQRHGYVEFVQQGRRE
jgi:hypothetical protein